MSELEQLSLNELPCTDPNCQENFSNNNNHHNTNNNNNEIAVATAPATNPTTAINANNQETFSNNDHLTNNVHGADDDVDNENPDDDRKESIDSQEFLLGENMTDSSSEQEREQMADNNCSGNCQQYADGSASCSGGGGQVGGEHNQNNDFYDPLMNQGVYCNDGNLYFYLYPYIVLYK